MSRLDMHHADDGLLLRYVDGELSARKSRQVRVHLEACWQCRTELQALQGTIGDCMRYRKTVLTESLPPAPAPWKPLDFEIVEAELASESLAARLTRLFSRRRNAPLGWVFSAAAVLVLAFFAIHKLGEMPNVEAAALLKKAVAVSEGRPHKPKRLRITTSRRQITRLILADAPQETGEAEIAGLFRAARYDWNDPLSPKAYYDWHGNLSHKQDQLATPDKDSYFIKTTTDEGELLSASLKMRATDFEAVEGRFEFRNGEWVEMTELVDPQTLPPSIVAGTTGDMSRQPGMSPVSSAPGTAPEVPAPSPVSEELQVFAALHQVGADLGDPIEINREGADVVVSGTGVSLQHQQQLHILLDRMPHVAVRFSDPSLPASNPPAPEPVTRDAAGPEKPRYPARLEARLGGRPQFERFSGQVLDWTDSAMSRVYAIKRLAQQFPSEAEARMTADERRVLHNLAREHAAALARDLRKITTTVNPVLSGMGAAGSTALPSTATQWQIASEELFASGRQVETLLAAVLGVSPNSPATEDAASQVLSAFARFTADAEHCLRLLSYDDVRQSK